MKKKTSKLVLSKETVRNLENLVLRQAQGGTTYLTYVCPTSAGRFECAHACIEP